MVGRVAYRRRRSFHWVFGRPYGLLTVVLATALAFGCGEDPRPLPPPVEEPVAEEELPPPEPEPIGLSELAPIALDPGKNASIDLVIERNENEGPIELAVGELPDGVTVKLPEIAEDGSEGKLEVAVAQKLGDEKLAVDITVTATIGELQAEQTLKLTINKLNLPSFQPVSGILLQAGRSKTIPLKVNRNGFNGPIELKVENLAAKVTAKVTNIEADKAETQLVLTTASDAADSNQPVSVVTTLFGRKIAAQMALQVSRIPYRLDCFRIVTVKPGEVVQVEIPIERAVYKGPLSLEVTNLPPGVTTPKLDVAANQDKVSLEFTAAEGAPECVRSAKIVSQGGNLSRTEPMIVRVTMGGQGFLPREITDSEEMVHLLQRGSFAGRLTTESKQALANTYGGSPESEQAVLKGLKWLAAHQQPDGHWSMQHYDEGIEDCDCKIEFESEALEFDTASTAFGVLAFLGAGVTHNRAPDQPEELDQYRDVVEKALVWLSQQQVYDRNSPSDGHLGGNMYAHALGTIAFCEAYGLSADERLKINAQLAIKYLKDAQHKDGGWRYGRQQAGDLSVTAWVFLAIRSGQLAGLKLDRSPLIRAERFVDSCAAGPEGAELSQYTYLPEQEPRISLTAAGLFTRQYLGWRKDNPDLLAGCQELMKNQPPTSGGLGKIYYYHYATQVLHNMEGTDFDLWNYRMREHIIRTQEKSGHKAGSWNPQGTDHGAKGGRMYATGMALLTLQTYYRHLPMYRPVIRTHRKEPG